LKECTVNHEKKKRRRTSGVWQVQKQQNGRRREGTEDA